MTSEYQQYLERCKEFHNITINRNEINFTKDGYYKFSPRTDRYEFSTLNYSEAAEMNGDGITHIYVSKNKIEVNI